MSTKHAPSSSRPATPDKGKGKAKAVESALEEALSTPLSPPDLSASPSALESDFSHRPISHPQPTHPPAHLRPQPPPRLLSDLTRSTLPSSSWNYAHRDEFPQLGEPSHWRSSPTTALSDEPFPDLDPTTGLPLSTARLDAYESGPPSLHLQRTITGLLSAPPRRVSSPVSSSSSWLPSLPSMPFTGVRDPSTQKRSISSSAPNDDWSSWATGWWSAGNKQKVDGMMSEDDKADTVEEEKEKIRRKYRTPKNPIVFCHGLLGFDYIGPAKIPPLQISHWRGIREVLESNGVEVLIGRVPATASIQDRAAILEELIAEKFPGREVNLIGHSMGGLDCRYLISVLRPTRFHICSLTTISTPHRGSPFADYVIDNLIGRDRLPSLLSLMQALRLPDSGDGSAFNALGTRAMKEFNAEVADRADVQYYSWGASFDPGLLDTFRWPHSVILAKEGPNDGLVSVKSAKWGEYRGTLLGVNHLDLVGWVNTVRYVFSEWTGKPIAFKPATFYLEVSDYLAEQGF